MKRLLLFLGVMVPMVVFGQLFGEDYEYSSEIIWGINKNTNGGLIGGLMVRYSRIVGKNFFETYGIELSNVKHPSESRYIGQSGASFIYGKSNYLYAIRLQYGREKVLYRKAAQQGVQINAGVAAGPTFGLLNPYFVLNNEGFHDPFDVILHPAPTAIAGPGKLFQGLGQTELVPGLNVKAGLSFEFGTYRSNIAGVEVGLMAELYTKEIVLVPTQPNRSVFASAFFTLFWGTRK